MNNVLTEEYISASPLERQIWIFILSSINFIFLRFTTILPILSRFMQKAILDPPRKKSLLFINYIRSRVCKMMLYPNDLFYHQQYSNSYCEDQQKSHYLSILLANATLMIQYSHERTSMLISKNRDRLHFWREEHPAASKGFAFASLLTQASIASRCQFRSAGSKIGGGWRVEHGESYSVLDRKKRSTFKKMVFLLSDTSINDLSQRLLYTFLRWPICRMVTDLS